MKYLIAILIFFSTAYPQTTVFPGAVGFGATANTAGRGAPIVHVTSLADDGTGGVTLREALAVSGAKTIVFDVSGTIMAVDWITLSQPFCTIAGETAPSPGITIRNYGLRVRTHDVLIRHIRVRLGDTSTDPCSVPCDVTPPIDPWPCCPPGEAEVADAFENLASTVDIYNIAIDHCSFSWGIDETFSIYGTNQTYNAYNIDVTWCIVSESLMEGHGNPDHQSDGFLIGSTGGAGQYDISATMNLLASNNARNPTTQCQNLFWSNNYVDNWGGKAIVLRYEGYVGIAGYGAITGTNIIGNYYQEGINTNMGPNASWLEIDGNAGDASDWPVGSFVYESDNVYPAGLAYTDDTFPEVFVVTNGLPGYVPFAASAIPGLIPPQVGARPRDRDAVDIRVITDVIANNGALIDSQDDVGGWPVLAQNLVPFVPVADPNGEHHNGWTNLEWQLHQLSQRLIMVTRRGNQLF